MLKFLWVLIFMSAGPAQALLPLNNPNVDQSSHTDVRLYKTKCDARWAFDKYMKCLDESRLIPGVRASYFTLRGRARFYKQSQVEGAIACRPLEIKSKSIFKTCVNRFVAHKAQSLGSGESHNFSSLNFLNANGSVE